MVWLHEHSRHDLVDLVFYLPFHTRVEFLHCLMIKILAKNIRQHSKLNMMIEMNLK